MNGFPVFDSPRTDLRDQRHVQHESSVTMRVDAATVAYLIIGKAVAGAVLRQPHQQQEGA